MKWKKPSQQLIDAFNRLVPDEEGVEKRKMFGYPCSFVNNNMFMGIHQENMFLRLSEHDRPLFLKLNETRYFEPIAGRFMKEYVVVPQWMLEKQNEVQNWIRKSLKYVSSLPPKIKEKNKK